MPNIVVYTAIAGGRDTLKLQPIRFVEEARFVAFVDNPTAANHGAPWSLQPFAETHPDPCRTAKRYVIDAQVARYRSEGIPENLGGQRYNEFPGSMRGGNRLFSREACSTFEGGVVTSGWARVALGNSLEPVCP
jgi:hypothetical protein